MTTQQPNRFTQQAWTTAVGKTQPQRIDPQVAHDLTKTWARRNAHDLRYALNECKQVKLNCNDKKKLLLSSIKSNNM